MQSSFNRKTEGGMLANIEKKVSHAHFPVTCQILKKMDAGVLQDGLTFKTIKIDAVALVARIVNVEKKKICYNITLDDSTGQVTVSVQKSPMEDLPMKLRDVLLEVNNYVEVVITPRKGSEERVYLVERMKNLEDHNGITHHLLLCLEGLMSAGLEYAPPQDDHVTGGSAIKDHAKDSQPLDLSGVKGAEALVILIKKAKDKTRKNKFETHEINELTKGYLDPHEVQKYLKELVDVADLTKSNEGGKVLYELTI